MADFSNNIVNQRFRTLYDELYRQGHIRGKSDIAEKLGTYNHVINSILKGQRNITIEQLSKLFEHYQANANYLFGLSNKMFLKGAPGAGSIPTLSIDAPSFAGRQNIVLVPDRAMAGYALQHQDADFLDGLQHFSIPNLEGELIAFEISGDSMMPTITNGDLVVCESLERGSPLRDNQVYVIVTDVVVAKRIQQIREGNRVAGLRLISDNGVVYKPYEVELEEVRQILRVKCRLTSHAIG
ncbi:MAG: S24 family peptidase [Bacteroidota bacterium]